MLFLIENIPIYYDKVFYLGNSMLTCATTSSEIQKKKLKNMNVNEDKRNECPSNDKTFNIYEASSYVSKHLT